jgi:hypothetical protein
MTPAPRLLQSLRFLPEPTKRKLRPLFRQTVNAIRALPGGQLPGKALRLVAPGAHRWLLRRYTGYQETAVIVGQFEQPNTLEGAPPAGLPQDALLSYGRLLAVSSRSH